MTLTRATERRNGVPLTDRITYFFDFRSGILVGVFSGITAPLIPIIGRRMGLDATGLAVLSVMQYAGLFLSFVVGHLAENRRKMPFVVWPGVISRGLFLAFAFVTSPLAFLIIVSIFYFLANVSSPAYSAIMQMNYSEHHRPKLMGNVRIGVTVATAVSAYLAGFFLHLHPSGYRWLFPLAAVFGMGSSLTFGRIRVRADRIPSAVRPRLSIRETVRGVRGDHKYIIFMIVFFLTAAPSKLTISVEPIRLVNELHISYASAGLLLGTVSSLFGMIGYYLWPRLASRFDPFVLLAAVAVLTGLRSLDFGFAPSVALLFPGVVFDGLNNSGWDLFALVCILRLSPPQHVATYWGLHLTLLGVRGVVGPIIGTALYEMHLMSIVGLYAASGVLTIVGAAMLLLFAQYLRKSGLTRIQPVGP